MSSSKQQQVNEVVEGLGVGLIALDRRRVSTSKLRLEFAFMHAWRRWDRAGDYPSIGNAPKPDNVIWIGVGRSGRRIRSTVVWRDTGGAYEIDTHPRDLTPSEAAADISSQPLENWVSLASHFLERYDTTAQR